MLKFLLEKEFKQIRRNSFMPRIILIFPVMVLLVFPWAANFEIRNINISIVDHDHSTYSQRLTNKIASSGYFRITGLPSSYQQALREIENDQADILLEIPRKFEQSLISEQQVKVMVSANAVNGTKGGLGGAYLSSIVNDFAGEIRNEWIQISGIQEMPVIELSNRNLFNIHMNYKVFMVPALMVMLLTMLCGFLPALNIVAEKEAGTMEQINVTPVPKFTFIMAKLIPYWIIGFIVISIGFVLAWLVYGLVPAGSLGTIYVFAAVYILTVSGLGLVISNYSNTMQQAMFVMYFFVLILIIMSGLFTPINSMPPWAQTITHFNPLKYFMQVMRLVYLKGSGVPEMTHQLTILGLFAFVLNIWAVLSYKKSH